MLQNKNVKTNLAELSYEMKVQIYDIKCKGCKNSLIEVVDTSGVRTKMDMEEAINLCTFKRQLHLERSCSEDDGYSLDEIIRNSCILWGDGEHDTDEDVYYEQ